MQGHAVTRKNAPSRLGYQCKYRSEYPADETHPRSLFVAEARILPVVDEWLGSLSSVNLDRAVAEMLKQLDVGQVEPAEVRRARVVAADAQVKLDRYMDATEKGMDPVLYVERSRTAQHELAGARAVVEAYRISAPPPFTGAELRELLERIRNVVELLRHADADERRQFYQELGLRLEYQRLGGQEKLRAHLGVGFLRVGGGT